MARYFTRIRAGINNLWENITGSGVSVIENDDGTSAEPPETVPYALYNRLNRESSPTGEVRLLTTDDLENIDELIKEIIFLMFNLSLPKDRGYVNTQSKLADALEHIKKSERKLVLFRSVFYIYVSEDYTNNVTYEELLDRLYVRLIKLFSEHEPVKDFINARFTRAWEKLHPDEGISFNPGDEKHTSALKYFIPCHISIHHRKFPTREQSALFLVGRSGLHDLREIERREEELAAKGAAPTVLHALTVRTTGEYQGARLRFTAHSFATNSPTTKREPELFLGNWRSGWSLTMGSAEHDEIQCPRLEDQVLRISLNNLRLEKTGWEVDSIPPRKPPKWLAVPDEKLVTEDKKECARLLVVKEMGLSTSLRNRLMRPEFTPSLSLEGRVLPFEGGQLPDLIANSTLYGAVAPLKPKAAIHVYRDSLWLVRTAEEKVLWFVNNNGVWSPEEVSDKEYPFGDIKYVWVKATGNYLPDGYCGELKIYPSDKLKGQVVIQLSSDPQAGELPLVRNLFGANIHPDNLLGSKGVLTLRCAGEVEGRPAYTLHPVAHAIHPFVAFKPPISLNGGPNGWQVFNGNEGDNLQIENQMFVYNNNPKKKVEVVGSENTLICGSSVFQIKTSGTPVNGAWTFSEEPAAQSSTGDTASPAPAEFNPLDAESVKMALLTTKWGSYDFHELSHSNIAVHYSLQHKEGESRFLKAYFPKSGDNAERERAFYENFRSRAAEIFIEPPEDVLRSDTGGRVWGLIFPRHRQLTELIPTPTIPQTVAIGYGVARLLKALDDEGYINYDLESSILCLNEAGRLTIVDFDNVFPLFNNSPSRELLTIYNPILTGGVLPIKSSSLPPEVEALTNKKGYARQAALAEIQAPFNVYMLAVILLQLLDLKISSESGEFSLAERTDAGAAEKQEFEALLQSMLKQEVWNRPSMEKVLTDLDKLTASIAANDAQAREEIVKLGIIPSAS